jgi:pulcherriminic acid synthase
MFDPARLHDDAHDADPVGVWEELRDDHPVFYDSIANVYMVTRHEDVRRAFAEQDTFSSRIYRKTMGRVFGPMLLQMEGRDHVKRRTIVAPLLMGVRLSAYHELIDEVARDVIDDAFAGGGPIDVVEDIAHRMPVSVIATLLGLPREDYGQFFVWYEAMMAGVWVDDEARRRGREAANELKEYIAPMVEARRRSPGDDLISRLVHAEADGERLEPGELGAYVALLLTAGGETTDKSISNLAWSMLSNPDELAAFRRDPERLDRAFSETMRILPPLIYVGRETKEAVSWRGVDIEEGREVRLAIGSANRDERVYAEPGRFWPDRPDLHEGLERRAAPTKDGRASHLAFGAGPHFCLGYQLARYETTKAVGMLLDRLGERPEILESTGPLVDGPTRSVRSLVVTRG